MGPIDTKWIRENGDGWASGRIDIRGIPGEPYGDEYTLPIMRNEDWCLFCEWLSNVKTPKQISREALIDWFERDNNHQMVWVEVKRDS